MLQSKPNNQHFLVTKLEKDTEECCAQVFHQQRTQLNHRIGKKESIGFLKSKDTSEKLFVTIITNLMHDRKKQSR